MLRQMINLAAVLTIPGKVILLERFLAAIWSVGPGIGRWGAGPPVLSLLVLLALCDGSRHGTLALVDITDAHPLPVD